MNVTTSSPLQGASILVDVNLPCASTRLTQTFINDSDSVIEAVYQFPVPRNAVLGNVNVVIAGKAYKGQVLAKHRAEQSYEQGVSEGKRAVLISDVGDGLYEVNLGNLGCNESAEIELYIHQMLTFDNAQAKYYLPTVIAPKYGSSQLSVEHQPKSNALVEYAFTGQINMPRGSKLISGSHKLDIQNEVGFFCGFLDQDISFSFDAASMTSSAISVEHDGGYSLMGCVAAPNVSVDSSAERAVQLLVDCSGSMGGVSMDHLKNGLEEALLDIPLSRKLNIIKYGSCHESLFNEPREFNGIFKETIEQCVTGLQANMGGTEIYSALETALSQVAKSGMPSDIILITDGQVWEQDNRLEKLFAQAQQLGVRIFCIGVGYAISESILQKMSQRTDGTLSLVNPHENMANAICDVMAKSQFGGMQIDVNIAADHTAFVEHTKFIYGRQMVPFFARSLCQPYTVNVSMGNRTEQIKVLAATDPSVKAVKQLVANRYIQNLEELEATQYAVLQGIVTQHTSYVMVSAEVVENADGMPELHQVSQMQKRSSPINNKIQTCASMLYMKAQLCDDFRHRDVEVDCEISMSMSCEPIIEYDFDLKEIEQYLDRRHPNAMPVKSVLLVSFLTSKGFDVEAVHSDLDEAQYCATFLLELADKESFVFSTRVQALLESIRQSAVV
ncbi:VIT and vWA domain-containing protein [Vibrio rarus]|uniref:VIT and vWA domain-containing protein n=1 Tax=Vibrio rarus TaxID=413403 RepID=UPI0021C2A766|nr:VIT and VWA domain-containing protein [Vibrio rarus]